MDDIAAATASQPACRIKIGRPVPNEWEEEFLPDAIAALPTHERTDLIAISARVQWRQHDRQCAVEAWDTTDPERPHLIAAWQGFDLRDEIEYRRLCGELPSQRFRLSIGEGRRIRIAPMAVEIPTLPAPRSLEEIMRSERARMLGLRRLRDAGSIYGQARTTLIDTAATRWIAAHPASKAA